MLSLHCHHQNDSCIKMGSDESRFNVSLIVRDKITRQCPETRIFEEKGEPKRIRTEVPLLTILTPYRWAKPAHNGILVMDLCIYRSLILVILPAVRVTGYSYNVHTPTCLRP